MHQFWKIRLILLCFGSFFSIQTLAGINSWTATGPSVGLLLTHSDSKISVSPHNFDIIYCYCKVSGESQLKLFKSSDGGKAWDALAAYPGDGNLQFHHSKPLVLYTSDDRIKQPETVTVYRSIDGGISWKTIFVQNDRAQSGILSLRFLTADGETLLIQTQRNIHTEKSTDGGISWQPALEWNRVDVATLQLDRHQEHVLYAGDLYSEIGLMKSLDNGKTWQPLTNLIVKPKPGQLYFTNNPALLYAFGKDPQSSNLVLLQSTDGGMKWLRLGGFNGRPRALTIAKDNTLYLTSIAPIPKTTLLFKSADNGKTWQQINQGEYKSKVVFMVVDPENSDVLIMSTLTDGLFETIDSGRHWRILVPGKKFLNIRRLIVGPVPDLNLYALAGDGIYMSEDSARLSKH